MADTILIGEDEPVQRAILSTLLGKKLGYKTLVAENGREVIAQIAASNIGDISAVLLDLQMPEIDGFETLAHIRKYRPDLPVIILTGEEDIGIAVKAIKAGASDFIVKPAEPMQLDVSLKNAIRLSALSRELSRLKRDKEGALAFQDLVGHSGGLAEAVAYGRKAAACDVPVLIFGETGTGRELLARAIHGESRRAGAPFVTLHCGNIPINTLETVLFGQEKTVTSARVPGKFREAERGTLFLDDVHALSPEAQTKLLRVLQQRQVEPIGATVPTRVNVRVVSASDRELKPEVEAGRFREDLYFLLNVLTIAMPPLRERKHDILLLADYFIQRFSSQDALPVKTFAADARHYLLDYAWPGNIRELESLMHRALVLSESDTISRATLAQIHEVHAAPTEALLPDNYIALKRPSGMLKTLAEIENEAMQKALEHYNQNITRAAEALGMAKSTFYRKIKEAPQPPTYLPIVAE